MIKGRIVEIAVVVLAGFGVGVLLSLAVGRYAGINFILGVVAALAVWYGLKAMR